MSDCRECKFQSFRPTTGPAGDKQSLGMCGLHAVSSDYARMQWWLDTANTIPSEENCGPTAKFWQARAT